MLRRTIRLRLLRRILPSLPCGNPVWKLQRPAEEWRLRQLALDEGRQFSPRWFLAFDADERIEPAASEIDGSVDSIAFRLFDAYITAEDVNHVGTARRWFGPEYRDIVMLFRNNPDVSYWLPDQRVIAGVTRTIIGGAARHYGKAISLEEHERTCDYYARHFPEPYRSKWIARKGGAVHTESDFGRALYRWGEVAEHGVELHDAAAPRVAPEEIQRAMGRARLQQYLCGRCGAPLVSHEREPGRWSLDCSAGHGADWARRRPRDQTVLAGSESLTASWVALGGPSWPPAVLEVPASPPWGLSGILSASDCIRGESMRSKQVKDDFTRSRTWAPVTLWTLDGLTLKLMPMPMATRK